MLHRTVSRCALSMEPLEQKNLLAGDVTVAIVDGDVLVSGDQESNHVRIVADPAESEFVIRGLPSADGIATTVNGQESAVRIDGLNRDLKVRLFGGNDQVQLPAGTFRNVDIATGRGADDVHVGRLDPTPEVSESGDGPAALDVSMLSLDIATGRGPDRVIENDLFVAEQHRIHTGQGSDVVLLGVAADGLTDPLGVRSGGDLNIQLALGNDTLRARDVKLAGDLHLRGGRGDDDLRLTGVVSPGSVVVRGGQGSDRLELGDSAIGHLQVDAGAGHDRAAIVDSTFADLWIRLGAGNDRIAIGDNTMGSAILFGGSGRDTLVSLGGNQAHRFFVGQVENVVDGPDNDGADEEDDLKRAPMEL